MIERIYFLIVSEVIQLTHLKTLHIYGYISLVPTRRPLDRRYRSHYFSPENGIRRHCTRALGPDRVPNKPNLSFRSKQTSTLLTSIHLLPSSRARVTVYGAAKMP